MQKICRRGISGNATDTKNKKEMHKTGKPGRI